MSWPAAEMLQEKEKAILNVHPLDQNCTYMQRNESVELMTYLNTSQPVGHQWGLKSLRKTFDTELNIYICCDGNEINHKCKNVAGLFQSHSTMFVHL